MSSLKNSKLYQELTSFSEELEHINQSVIKIGKLQHNFSENVTIQHYIEKIAGTVLTAKENVLVGNEKI